MIRNLGLSLFLLAVPQIGWAESVPATVTSMKGDVAVTDPSGQRVQATIGSKLPAGDTIKTGANGFMGITLTPGSGTVVQPNTTVKISSLDFNKGADGSNNRKIELNLKNGSLISTLFKKDGHSDFHVVTPYGVAAAKGTSWLVTVEGTSLTVEVANGVVTVTNAAGEVLATIPVGQGYDSTTGKVTALPQSAVDGIVAILKEYLPNLTNTQLLDVLNSATINPATVNNKDQINSPNK